MPQEIKGYFLTKQEIKAIKYFTDRAAFLYLEVQNEIKVDKKAILSAELEYCIHSLKTILNNG